MELTKNQILKELELETVFNKMGNGEISIEGMHDSIKKQMIDFAKKKKDKFIKGLYDSIDNGLITVSMIGGNIKQYISEHTIIEQSIIDKLSDVDDTVYHITDSLLNSGNDYKSIKHEIDENGYIVFVFEDYKAKVYNPELVCILLSKDLRVTNEATKSETTINAFPYIETYVKGYKEGEQNFLDEFKVSSDILYSPKAEQYVRDIHLNYYHVTHYSQFLNFGWVSIKKRYPTRLTHKAIKEIGYYSGIVNKVEEMIKKHPQPFANFNKCDHDLTPEQAVTQTNKNKGKKSYVWQSNADKELPKLYKLMIDKYKLIGPDTKPEQFKAVFTGQPIESINPIKWEIAKNLNAYFIEQLFEKKKLSKAHNADLWDIAKCCFVDGNNFSQLIDLYTNNKTGKPNNHKLIDDLLNAL